MGLCVGGKLVKLWVWGWWSWCIRTICLSMGCDSLLRSVGGGGTAMRAKWGTMGTFC